MVGFFPLVLISWVLFLVGQRKEGLAEGKLHIFHTLSFTSVHSRIPSIQSLFQIPANESLRRTGLH